MRIEFENGVVFDTANLYRVRNLIIDDIDSTSYFENATGVRKAVYYGTDYEQRIIELEFEARIDSAEDFEEKRSDLQRIFNSGAGRFILKDFEIDVIKNGKIAIERVNNAKLIANVTLINVGLPYFKSTNLETTTIVNGATLNINNVSDVELDPRYTDVVLRFTLHESVNFFQITSASGAVLRINLAMSNDDVIELRDGTTYLNGIDILEDTTMEIITIPIGASTLRILGGTQYKFDLEYTNYKY